MIEVEKGQPSLTIKLVGDEAKAFTELMGRLGHYDELYHSDRELAYKIWEQI